MPPPCRAVLAVFCLQMLRPPRPTLFPYTTLFRSHADGARAADARQIVPQEIHDHHVLGPVLVALHERARQRRVVRSEEHTSELQSHSDLVCRLLLEKKNSSTCCWQARTPPAVRRS